MKNIYVLAEHRKGMLRDITWEAIAAGRKLSSELGAELTCILLASQPNTMSENLSSEGVRVKVVNDPIFETMNSEAIIKVLKEVLTPSGSYVLLMGASNAILDFAPGVSVALDAALATDQRSVEGGNQPVDSAHERAVLHVVQRRIMGLGRRLFFAGIDYPEQ